MVLDLFNKTILKSELVTWAECGKILASHYQIISVDVYIAFFCEIDLKF